MREWKVVRIPSKLRLWAEEGLASRLQEPRRPCCRPGGKIMGHKEIPHRIAVANSEDGARISLTVALVSAGISMGLSTQAYTDTTGGARVCNQTFRTQEGHGHKGPENER